MLGIILTQIADALSSILSTVGALVSGLL